MFPVFNGLILYAMDMALTPRILEEANNLGFQAVMLGIWDPRSQKELTFVKRLIEKYKATLALALIIGNEGLAFHRYRLQDLHAAARLLQMKRAQLLSPSAPVSL